MSLRSRRPALVPGGRGRWLAAAAVVALAGASLGWTPLARADDWDDAANAEAAAAQRVAQLKADLQGIDATLAQVYLDLDALTQQIPVAEKQLEDARTAQDSAERDHEVALGQLDSSRAEQERLARQIEEAEKQQADATRTIGGLARELYRGGTPNAMVVAMTAQTPAQLGQRAAMAEAAARSQDRALGSALGAQSTTRNRKARQEATTARVADLEAKAAAAAAQAKEAAAQAKAKVEELDSLKASAEAKKKEWDAKKADATKQLSKWEAEHKAAQDKLAAIDAENRRNNVVYTQSSAGGGPFGSPLPISLVVTSPFGWRVHPVLGIERFHNGTDFAADCGTPVLSIGGGVVSAVTFEEAGGNVVYVSHGMVGGSSMSSAYVHLQSVNVSVGQTVAPGTVVGEVGTTGYSTGCHLHLSVMQDGADVDPMGWL
ncbi:peptidoglycan DD-metalloendopeptidase family protein [Schaalia sp. 19OD2882]|uniref:peptidoglycan DD-metalloendopeptidase family protein n=1 Tax=Schaalia sp. 19OD2882 TaxID=2794089 RepID=UPI001C1EFB3A|nr:M23 family metallopeptidase [Schaalia sp. 19OD2882]QWW20110.1 peptidoglycan DD-metalloendopeptidase family protein [Schaalia sp. 19OD2882]